MNAEWKMQATGTPFMSAAEGWAADLTVAGTSLGQQALFGDPELAVRFGMDRLLSPQSCEDSNRLSSQEGPAGNNRSADREARTTLALALKRLLSHPPAEEEKQGPSLDLGMSASQLSP